MPPGDDVTETIGTSPGSTNTVARAVVVMPDPVALSVYSVVFEGVTVRDPDVATGPMPASIVTSLAPVVVHVRVDVCPGWMKLGLALNVMEGPGAFTPTLTVR